jgi:hypothetical protein
MKRSLYLIPALLATVVMTSCMKQKEMTVEERMQITGANLYNSGASSHGMLMIPARIALRLNTLIYEAELQEIDMTDPNFEVMVEIDGRDVDCREALFSNAAFRVEDDVITVVYPQNYDWQTSGDYPLEGEISFDTDGGMLYEGQWTISTGTTEQTRLRVSQSDGYNTATMFFDWSSYSFGSSGLAVYDLQNYNSGKEDLASSWNADMYLATDVDYFDNSTLENFTKMILTQDGECSGTMMKYHESEPAVELFYESDGVEFHYACSLTAPLSGEETVYSYDLDETWPDDEVTVTWTKAANQCARTGVMDYAGYRLDL